MLTETLTGKALGAGEGKPLAVIGNTVTIKLHGEETGGAFAVFEVLSPPEAGAPLHVNHREDELHYVVDGEFEFELGEQVIRAEAGSSIYVPRGTTHSFRNVGAENGRLLFVVSPPGLERLFEELDEMGQQGTPPEEELMARIAGYELEFLHSERS